MVTWRWAVVTSLEHTLTHVTPTHSLVQLLTTTRASKNRCCVFVVGGGGEQGAGRGGRYRMWG